MFTGTGGNNGREWILCQIRWELLTAFVMNRRGARLHQCLSSMARTMTSSGRCSENVRVAMMP